MADIQINQLLESTTAAGTDWIAIDNGSATKKISVTNFNATGAASAAQSAAAAAQSASDAADAKTAAEQAEADTEALITSAQTIVSDAQTYAGEAATSANTASTAANTATAQAAIATQAASTAAGYAANVDNFAKTAKSWAVGGTGTRSGEDTDNSKYYSQQAHDSEINAAASESNASTSETNAAASESTASSAASSASTNALKAEGYAVGTQNGTPAASGETYYHDNAKYYKEEAATSATNAGASETNAGLSEVAAAASESAAKGSEEDSEAWAWGKIDGVDVPATHPAYHNNAKYWADAASGGVSGVSSFNGRSGVVVPASGDYAANIVEFDPSNNALISTTVQGAIEEVQGNVETLNSSLATVATTGAYSDLSGKPTLGTAAAKDATSSVTSGSTDLIESGAVYSGLSVKANSADLGTAAGKDFTTSISSGSGDLITSGAVYTANQTLTNQINKAYKSDDSSETTIDGADYIPFYDSSASAMKKILVSNADFGSASKADKTDLTSILQTGATATQAISRGEYFYLNGTLVRALTNIAIGATFTLNTNYTVVSKGALNDDVDYIFPSQHTSLLSYTSLDNYYTVPSDGYVKFALNTSGASTGQLRAVQSDGTTYLLFAVMPNSQVLTLFVKKGLKLYVQNVSMIYAVEYIPLQK